MYMELLLQFAKTVYGHGDSFFSGAIVVTERRLSGKIQGGKEKLKIKFFGNLLSIFRKHF